MNREAIAELSNLFADGRQITVTHFYPIGDGWFSVGYVTHDRSDYEQGCVWYDDGSGTFNVSSHGWHRPFARSWRTPDRPHTWQPIRGIHNRR